jgi:hypothetical protein
MMNEEAKDQFGGCRYRMSARIMRQIDFSDPLMRFVT